jgi:hypothetical protein
MVLFKDFKKVSTEYKSSVKLWEAITEVTLYKHNALNWLNLNSDDFDGNPILIFYNHEEKRQIRVIQQTKSNDTRDFVVFFNRFGDEKNFHGTELVVTCILSEKNIDRYKKILDHWLTNPSVKIDALEKVA